MNHEYPTDHEGEPRIEQMLNEIGIDLEGTRPGDRYYRIGGEVLLVGHEQFGELRVMHDDYGWYDIPIIELWEDWKNGLNITPVRQMFVSDTEVVISRLTLAVLADWADLDIMSMDEVEDDVIRAVDDAYDTLGHER